MPKSERSGEPFEISCQLLVAAGRDDAGVERARNAVKSQIAFYGSTRTYAGVFELHGWDGTSERLHELQRKGDLPAMAATITDEMLDVYVVTATWDDLPGALAERYAGVADRLVMYGATEGWAGGRGAFERWRGVADALGAGVGAAPTD